MLRTRVLTLAATGVLAVAAAAAVVTPSGPQQVVSDGARGGLGSTGAASTGAGDSSGPAGPSASTGQDGSGAPTQPGGTPGAPTAGNGSSAATAGPLTTSGAGGSTSTFGVAPSGSGAPSASAQPSRAPMDPSSVRGGIGGSGTTSHDAPSPSSKPTAGTDHPTQTSSPSPLLDGGVPEPGFTQGALVDGFPAALGPPAGTDVASSSVSVAGNVLQASLVASGGDPEQVVDHYRDVLTDHGFTEQEVAGAQDEQVAAFVDGRDVVTVTTQDDTTYLVATLRVDDPQD